MQVVDVETGLPVGPYRTGELHIKAPTVTRGYSRKTGTVSAVDEGGWLASGDLVYYNEDGRFYYYERIKSLIKCLDYEVAPSELEEILLSHPFVAEAVVVGVLHPEFGEVAKAFVVIKDSVCPGMSPTSQELQEFVAESQHLTKGTAVGYVEEIQDSAAIAVISEDASPTQNKTITSSELDIDPPSQPHNDDNFVTFSPSSPPTPRSGCWRCRLGFPRRVLRRTTAGVEMAFWNPQQQLQLPAHPEKGERPVHTLHQNGEAATLKVWGS
ncbi:putative acyl-CoA synthetase [Ixodes scapularis]